MLQHKRFKGFTLIELLVVVAIIALLIAILLPSLGKAKDRAKLTQCGTNLHALTAGALVYAAEWQNYLPPMRGQGTGGYSATLTYQMNNGSTLYGFGLLYSNGPKGTSTGDGAITDFRVFYCPAQQNMDFQLDPNLVRNTSGGYLSLSKSAPGGGRTGYQFQLHCTDDSKDVRFTRQVDYPQTAVVAADLLWRDGNPLTIAHGNATSAKFNMSFIDGHVDAVQANQALMYDANHIGSAFADTGTNPGTTRGVLDMEQSSQNIQNAIFPAPMPAQPQTN